METSGIINY